MIMEKSKIQKFVEGLANSEMTDSQQSIVLSRDGELIGAADNPGCSNYNEDACTGTNENCVNYGKACTNGVNPHCKNLPSGVTPGGSTIGKVENP